MNYVETRIDLKLAGKHLSTEIEIQSSGEVFFLEWLIENKLFIFISFLHS